MGTRSALIAIVGEEIEGGHHGLHLFTQFMHLGRDIAGVKDVIAGKLFLHVRHGFQGLVVVVEQAPEMGEFFLQANLFALFRFFEKASQEFKHSSQLASQSVVSCQ